MIERLDIGGLAVHVVRRDGRQCVLLAPLGRALGVSPAGRRRFEAGARISRRIGALEVGGERQQTIDARWLEQYLSELWAARDGISRAAQGRVWRLRRSLAPRLHVAPGRAAGGGGRPFAAPTPADPC